MEEEDVTIIIPNEGTLTDDPDEEEDEFELDKIIDVANDIVPPDDDE